MKIHRMNQRPVRRGFLGLAVGLAALTVPLIDAAPSHASAAAASQRPASAVDLGTSVHVHGLALPRITVTVPNYFRRDCAYATGRCTAYRQIKGPYNRSVPSVYQTRWVWSPIW